MVVEPIFKCWRNEVTKEEGSRFGCSCVWRNSSHNVHVLQYLVYQVSLRQFDLPVCHRLHVETNVVFQGELVFNVELLADVPDCLVD